MMTSSISNRLPLVKLLVVLFVLAVALTSTLSGYLGERWVWQQVPELHNVQQLKLVQQKGLALPGWHTLEQNVVEIGGHKWSAQAIVPETEAATATLQQAVWLLLRPQTWAKDLPQIDWVDIKGVQRWDTDSRQQISFTGQSVTGEPVQVKAHLLRGWTSKRTNAVLQWYAWSKGGHPAPSHWFWADQWTQLRDRQRLSWVAVSLQMPIKPLGEIASAQSELEALGKLVQSTLTSTFQPEL
jgi:cyanoexosortase B-associated protein